MKPTPILACLLAVLLPGPLLAAETNTATRLELYAFISTNNLGEGHLNLRITNRGEKDQTVLTENFGIGFTSTLGSPFRTFDLRFDILTMGTKEKPNEWIFVSSLPKLAPVTLHKGETATLSGIALEKKLVAAMRETPDVVIPIGYTITEKIARRYGLWHGTLEVKETARSLLSK
jgi:hypothetical protein